MRRLLAGRDGGEPQRNWFEHVSYPCGRSRGAGGMISCTLVLVFEHPEEGAGFCHNLNGRGALSLGEGELQRIENRFSNPRSRGKT